MSKGLHGSRHYFKNKEDLDKFNKIKNGYSMFLKKNNAVFGSYDRNTEYWDEYTMFISKYHTIKAIISCYVQSGDYLRIRLNEGIKEEEICEYKVGDIAAWVTIGHTNSTCKFIRNYSVKCQIIKNSGLFSDLNKILFSYIW